MKYGAAFIPALLLTACATVETPNQSVSQAEAPTGKQSRRALRESAVKDYANNPDTQYSRIVVPDKDGASTDYYFKRTATMTSTLRHIKSPLAKDCEGYALIAGYAQKEWISICDDALSDPSLSLPNRRATFFNKGLIQYNIGQYVDARQTFERITQEYPNFAESYFGLALIEAQFKNWDTVMTLAQKSLSLKPEDPYQAYNLIGVAKEMSFAFNDARAAYEKANELRPGAAIVKRNLERMDRLWPADKYGSGAR